LGPKKSSTTETFSIENKEEKTEEGEDMGLSPTDDKWAKIMEGTRTIHYNKDDSVISQGNGFTTILGWWLLNNWYYKTPRFWKKDEDESELDAEEDRSEISEPKKEEHDKEAKKNLIKRTQEIENKSKNRRKSSNRIVVEGKQSKDENTKEEGKEKKEKKDKVDKAKKAKDVWCFS